MKKFNIVTGLFLVVLFAGCNKNKLNRFPEDQPNSATYYTTTDQLVLAVNAAYSNLSYAQDGYPYLMQLECTSDVMWQRPTTDAQAIGLGQHTPATTMVRTIWNQFYTGIGKCNMLLENMSKAKASTPAALFRRIEGEARFLRAYYYGNLISLYGDVPLVNKSINPDESFLPRTPRAEVLNFIFRDLDSAIAQLPLSYSGIDVGRATNTAAMAYKARIALYNEKWDVAAAASKQLIDLNYHSLYPNYRNLFTYAGENSRESIFAFDFKQTVRVSATPQNMQARNSSGFSGVVPTRAMVDSYECIDGRTIDKSPLYSTADPFRNRDPRMRQAILGDGDTWFGTGGITFNMTYHPDSTTCTRYTPTFAKITNLEVTNAFSSFSGFLLKKYLDPADLVRARGYGVAVGQTSLYPAVTSTSQSALREVVRRERKVELVGEGLRLFDIRRWKIADVVMNGILFGKAMNRTIYYTLPKPTLDANSSPNYSSFNSLLNVVGNFKIMDNPRIFKPHNYLWPIPQSEIDVNKNPGFVQNPGY